MIKRITIKDNNKMAVIDLCNDQVRFVSTDPFTTMNIDELIATLESYRKTCVEKL